MREKRENGKKVKMKKNINTEIIKNDKRTERHKSPHVFI